MTVTGTRVYARVGADRHRVVESYRSFSDIPERWPTSGSYRLSRKTNRAERDGTRRLRRCGPELAEYDPSRLGARLIFVALRVRDLEMSARFYREAIGIPLREAGGLDEETHREYSWTDGEYFHFALFPAAPGAETRSIELNFYVDDLDLAHRQATAAGAEVASMPQDQPWGRTASYRDPDGNVVGITQRPGLAGRSE
jgi:predicted enzyme related to lactoylglutathione lyase